MGDTSDMGNLCVWHVAGSEGDKQHSDREGSDQKGEHQIRQGAKCRKQKEQQLGQGAQDWEQKAEQHIQ